jgi:hypothetical protein
MENSRVSDFMLERYRLGELLPEDRKVLEEVFTKDENVRSRLIVLDESDRELRERYPVEFLDIASSRPPKIHFSGRGKGKIAAAILFCLTLPLVYYLRVHNQPDARGNLASLSASSDSPADRAKGAVISGSELSVFLKGDSEIFLGDQAVLGEGNTVQLAYTAPAGEHYGVIFSIDGRSAVTLHYPYRRGQSPVLVSGKRTFLDEAYTLDDAPLYEVFVMVVSEKPLNVEAVLQEARDIAGTEDLASIDLRSAEGKKRLFGARAAFDGCEVETLKVLKK